MQMPGLSGLLDGQPIGFGDWLTVVAIAVSPIVVMQAYKGLVARGPDAR